MEQAQIELLVIDMQLGCQQAFNQLCQHFHPSLLRFAFKICANEELALDAVQNAWLKMFSAIKTLNDPRAFKSWIYRAVRWQSLDLLRKKANDKLDFTDQSLTLVDNNQPDDEPSSLLALIELLPSIDRQALYLFYLEQMTLAEISVVIDVPIGTVKSRLNRARKQLKEKYQQQEQDNEY